MTAINDNWELKRATGTIRLVGAPNENDVTVPDLYWHISDYPPFPESFSSEDKRHCYDLVMWGECERRPRPEVIEFYESIARAA